MSGFTGKKIVAPCDFSELSLKAIQQAAELTGDPAKLEVVHVLAPLTPMEPGVVWSTINDNERAEHAEGHLKDRLKELGLEEANATILFGDAGREIAEFAEDQGADLVVISSHGHTGLTRLLLGSVAEKVVRLSPCPVLVIKPK